MNQYYELKNKHEKEMNNFPFMFAFSQKQFNEGMEKLGLQPDETDKIFSIGGGGYIRRTDSKALSDMMKRHEQERAAAIAADSDGTGFIYDMFYYELANHEYCITWDVSETLDALGFTIEEVNKDPRMIEALKRARVAAGNHNC